MEKLLFIFVLSSFFSFNSLAQRNDTSGCKCQYYSSYKIKIYRHKIDSILQIINKNYGKVIFIGYRSFSVANVLFITKTKGIYKAFFYNLIKGSSKVIKGRKVSEMADRILKETDALQNSTKIKPQYVSHDFSFFISYNNGKNIYEVCYSQVLTVKNNHIGQLFTYYLDNFK